MNVLDLTSVQVVYSDGADSTYLVPDDHVERFVEATVRLHHSPGKNPHNGNTTKSILVIRGGKLEATGPFWWTTPDLQKNSDPAGAVLWQCYSAKTLWENPILDEERRQDLLAEQEV